MNKSKGYYFGEYEIVLVPYFGPDFSRRCFIFPGQGAAFPGMFRDFYAQSKIFKSRFIEADQLAEKFGLPKISDYILNPGKLSEERMPMISNLALFTAECAIFDMLRARKIIPHILTGHSFGEYPSLVAAGVISFSDMFGIIYVRESVSPPPNTLGFMIAIFAGTEEVKDVLGSEEYHISNCNSPSQTVVSVTPSAAERIKNVLEERGVRFRPLTVPQPYHSPYIEGVQKEINKRLKEKIFEINPPQVPIFSSVLKKMIEKESFRPEDIRRILENQLIFPVDFIGQINSAFEAGCCNFIELGPKKIFSRFVEEILVTEKIKTSLVAELSFSGEKKIIRPRGRKQNIIFSSMIRIIGEITGYEIAKISFEDRFQEDLGIDSIKKADILLTFLDKSGIEAGEDFNTSSFKSVKDAVDYAEKVGRGEIVPKKSLKRRQPVFRRYGLFWRENGLGGMLDGGTRSKKRWLFWEMEDIFKKPDDSRRKLLEHLSDRDQERPGLLLFLTEDDFDYGKTFQFFKFFRQLCKEAAAAPLEADIFLVSKNVSAAGSAGYASFFKSMKKEIPAIFFKHICLEENATKDEIVSISEKESREPFGEDVLYRGGKRWTKRMELVEVPESGRNIGEKDIIFAIGGAKGITFSLVRNISDKYAPTIYLAGRSPKDSDKVRRSLETMKEKNEKVEYFSLDACDKEALEEAFQKIIKKHGKIDLVINGAGTVDVDFLANKDDSRIEYEFKNKILPAKNILDISEKLEIGKIINFSSVISHYGNAGQGIYTAANEIIDKLSAERVTVVHWPPWDGVGMTESRVVLQKLKEASGVAFLSPEKADELFFPELSKGVSRAVYYMDERDDLAYGFLSSKLSFWEKIIGKMEEAGDGKMIFRKDFDLARDRYLLDHKVGERVYVPAATAIAMFFCLARICFKKNPTLKDIMVLNPIILGEMPQAVFLESENKGNDNLAMFIRKKTLCFSGKAVLDQAGNGEKIDFPALKEAVWAASSGKGYFFDGSFEYGKTFRSLDEIFLDERGNAFSKVDDLKLAEIPELGLYGRLIQWIDAALQTVGASEKQKSEEAGRMMLPIGIGRLAFYGNVRRSKTFSIIIKDKKRKEDIVEADALVVNEAGEVFLSLSKIKLKEVANSTA